MTPTQRRGARTIPLQLMLEAPIVDALRDQAYISRQTISEYCREIFAAHLATITGPRTITVPQPPLIEGRHDTRRINLIERQNLLPKAAKTTTGWKPEGEPEDKA
jgi:hypothetical protein